MPVLDWIMLLVMAVSMAVGAWRGLVYEVLSVLGWLAAFVLAQWFLPGVAELLPMGGAGEALRRAAGFGRGFWVLQQPCWPAWPEPCFRWSA